MSGHTAAPLRVATLLFTGNTSSQSTNNSMSQNQAPQKKIRYKLKVKVNSKSPQTNKLIVSRILGQHRSIIPRMIQQQVRNSRQNKLPKPQKVSMQRMVTWKKNKKISLYRYPSQIHVLTPCSCVLSSIHSKTHCIQLSVDNHVRVILLNSKKRTHNFMTGSKQLSQPLIQTRRLFFAELTKKIFK